MEKKRRNRLIIIVAIVLAIASMSMVYASMSTRLDIHGMASMSGANWDIHFDNLSRANIVGQAKELVHPTITQKSTTIGNYNVKLEQPFDAISYTFDIVNAGGLDAALTTLNISTPTCSGIGDNALDDANTVCRNLNYKLTYMDGSVVKLGDTLNKKSSKKVKLTLEYKSDDMPVDEVKIDNLGIVLIYSQN